MVPPMVSLMCPRPVDVCHSTALESYEVFEARLIRALGATVGGGGLSRALGYPTQDAFRKAHQRGRVPIATFEVRGRRGRFAMVVDIAAWLWRERDEHCRPSTTIRGGAP